MQEAEERAATSINYVDVYIKWGCYQTRLNESSSWQQHRQEIEISAYWHHTKRTCQLDKVDYLKMSRLAMCSLCTDKINITYFINIYKLNVIELLIGQGFDVDSTLSGIYIIKIYKTWHGSLSTNRIQRAVAHKCLFLLHPRLASGLVTWALGLSVDDLVISYW